MELPRLIGAWPRALLDAERTRVERAAYSLTFALAPLPGGCALQRVETRILFLRGEEPLVEYHAVYWEWFLFAARRERRLDRHDFDLSRDGWGPDRVARLLDRHGLGAGAGPTRLRLEKRFLLGAGAVLDGAPVQRSPGGGGFGYVTEAEGERPWLRLRLGAEGREVDDAAAPLPGPAAGRASFVDGRRLCAEEELEFGFATLSGELRRRDYAPASAPGPREPLPLL